MGPSTERFVFPLHPSLAHTPRYIFPILLLFPPFYKCTSFYTRAQPFTSFPFYLSTKFPRNVRLAVLFFIGEVDDFGQ